MLLLLLLLSLLLRLLLLLLVMKHKLLLLCLRLLLKLESLLDRHQRCTIRTTLRILNKRRSTTCLSWDAECLCRASVES